TCSSSPSSPCDSTAIADASPACEPTSSLFCCSVVATGVRNIAGQGLPGYRRIDASARFWLGRQGVGAGDNLQDFLRDFRLAGVVHGQGQVGDQLAGVLRGAAPRGRAGTLLRGRGLEQGPVELRLDVDGQEPFEDLLRFGLVDEVAAKLRLLG